MLPCSHLASEEQKFEFLIPDPRMKVPVSEWRLINVPPLLLASPQIKTGDISANLQTGVQVLREVFNRVV